jgi:hypothetical protein
MEVVSSARVSVLPGLGDAPRVNAPPALNSVKTELPAKATVQQAAATPKPTAARSGPDPEGASEVSRDVTIDASTQELVFKTINQKSGEVVSQVPDKALLRIRAYSREQREAEAEAESERHVSRIA